MASLVQVRTSGSYLSSGDRPKCGNYFSSRIQFSRAQASFSQGTLPQLASRTSRGHSRRTESLVVRARRRSSGGNNRDEDRRTDENGGSSGFRFSNRRGIYRVQYDEYEAEIREDEVWKLAIPLVGGLVLAAAVIGPLIIGVVFTAIAVGAALSAGALFTSLFLPFFLFVGAGALFFGGLTFSAFATLGTALLLPKLISLAVVAGGLGLGAMAVSLFLRPAADRARVSYGKSGRGEPRSEDKDIVVEAEEKADPEVERQLREFDELLAGRDEQRQRTDRWKAGGR